MKSDRDIAAAFLDGLLAMNPRRPFSCSPQHRASARSNPKKHEPAGSKSEAFPARGSRAPGSASRRAWSRLSKHAAMGKGLIRPQSSSFAFALFVERRGDTKGARIHSTFLSDIDFSRVASPGHRRQGCRTDGRRRSSRASGLSALPQYRHSYDRYQFRSAWRGRHRQRRRSTCRRS